MKFLKEISSGKERIMKRIALSLSIIVAVAAIVSGATFALFSDNAFINNNTVSTGSLELTLDNEVAKPFSIPAMMPGDTTGWSSVDLVNDDETNTVPFETWVWLTFDTGSPDLWNVLEVEMADAGLDGDCSLTGDNSTIYNGLMSGLTGQPNETQTSDEYYAASGTDLDDIAPDSYQRLCQRLHLPSSADNTVQDSTVTFTEFFEARQDDGIANPNAD